MRYDRSACLMSSVVCGWIVLQSTFMSSGLWVKDELWIWGPQDVLVKSSFACIEWMLLHNYYGRLVQFYKTNACYTLNCYAFKFESHISFQNMCFHWNSLNPQRFYHVDIGIIVHCVLLHCARQFQERPTYFRMNPKYRVCQIFVH